MSDALLQDDKHPVLHLEMLTRFEAEEALSDQKMAIWPMGATEQHGPHLPLGTDTFIASYLAEKLARRTGGVILPVLPVSYSWVWRDNPVSLTLRMESLQALIRDVAHSLDRFGARTLVIISAHGANSGPLKYVARDLMDEVDMDIVYFIYPGIAEAASETSESPVWGSMFHACEVETSMLLAVRPDLCHMDRAVREYPSIPPQYGVAALPIGNISSSGVFGDPTLATPEKGETYLRAFVDSMVKTLTEMYPPADLANEGACLK